MYLVWTGYLLPVFLFLAIVRLGANYLRERQVCLKFSSRFTPNRATGNAGVLLGTFDNCHCYIMKLCSSFVFFKYYIHYFNGNDIKIVIMGYGQSPVGQNAQVRISSFLQKTQVKTLPIQNIPRLKAYRSKSPEVKNTLGTSPLDQKTPWSKAL